MHTGKITGPAKPKQRNGEGEAAHAGRRHLVLGSDIIIFVEMARLPAVFPIEIGWHGDTAG